MMRIYPCQFQGASRGLLRIFVIDRLKFELESTVNLHAEEPGPWFIDLRSHGCSDQGLSDVD
jgi:hypothetical protein